MKTLLTTLAVAALLVVPMASADNGKILLSPSTPHVGDSLVFSGCGYTPGLDIQLQAVNDTKPATYILQITETVDAAGCFSTTNAPYVVPAMGKWVTHVFDVNKWTNLSTLNFTVSG